MFFLMSIFFFLLLLLAEHETTSSVIKALLDVGALTNLVNLQISLTYSTAVLSHNGSQLAVHTFFVILLL